MTANERDVCQFIIDFYTTFFEKKYIYNKLAVTNNNNECLSFIA